MLVFRSASRRGHRGRWRGDTPARPGAGSRDVAGGFSEIAEPPRQRQSIFLLHPTVILFPGFQRAPSLRSIYGEHSGSLRAEQPSNPSRELAERRGWTGPTLANGALTAEHAEFCQSGISVVMASRARGRTDPHRPHDLGLQLGRGRARPGARLRARGRRATAIPYPGLPAPESQIALPVVVAGRTAGVLFAESPEPMRFRYDDEDALALVAARLGELMASGLDPVGAEDGARLPACATTQPIHVRHYGAGNSVFIDHDYLIKGVAGAICWKLVGELEPSGRCEVTNRELRLDSALRLPEFAENLEAQLVLLQRRLLERACPIQLEKARRGRLRLRVPGTVILEDIPAAGGKRTA